MEDKDLIEAIWGGAAPEVGGISMNTTSWWKGRKLSEEQIAEQLEEWSKSAKEGDEFKIDGQTYVCMNVKLPEAPPAEVLKPSNPKDMVGSDKIPFHLWPETASALGALALMDGNLKYGRTNWRAAGVKASIYYDALRRHVNAWFDEGEDIDPDSGLPHLAHALACIAIIIDAGAAGKLTDDRLVRGGYRKLMTEMTQHVRRLKEKHKDKHPKHYTIHDSEK